jgi:hypothetical protein
MMRLKNVRGLFITKEGREIHNAIYKPSALKTCKHCGKPIAVGELFTMHQISPCDPSNYPHCRSCYPFEVVLNRATAEREEYIEKLGLPVKVEITNQQVDEAFQKKVAELFGIPFLVEIPRARRPRITYRQYQQSFKDAKPDASEHDLQIFFQLIQYRELALEYVHSKTWLRLY